MTRPRRPFRIEGQEGSALVVSFAILLTVLIFSAATWQAAVVLTNRSNTQTDAQRAFQAADAGIDAAIHRISQLSASTALPQPLDAASCLTTDSSGTVVVSPPVSGAWCAETAPDAVDTRSSFTFSMTKAAGTGASPFTCVGDPSVNAASDRCIVATGVSNGVRRRIQVRVYTTGGTDTKPFTTWYAQAMDSIKVESSVTITSTLAVNNKLEVGKNTSISGPVTVGPKAKVKGITTYTRCGPTSATCKGQPVAWPPKDFARTAYHYDPVTEPGGNNNTTISSAYYTAGAPSAAGMPPGTRSLYVPKNRQVTLAPGTYNFCSIKIDGRGILNAAGTGPAAPVRIFLDSPFRPGSGCPKNTGTITAGGKATIVNPSLDPNALEIYAWGSATRKKRARLQVPLGKSGTLAAIIYAPQSEVRFGDNKGVLIGGVVGQRIVFKKSMRFIADSRVTNWTTRTVNQAYRAAWKQCSSTPTSPTLGC